MKSTKTTFYFFHLIPNEVRIAFDLTELRLCKPRARLFSCRDSLLHVLVFIFFSMIPIAPEGHRWRVTRAPDTGAVQQDVYRPSCKIWLNICRSLLICSQVSCLTLMLTFFVFIRSTFDTVLSISTTLSVLILLSHAWTVTPTFWLDFIWMKSKCWCICFLMLNEVKLNWSV